MAVTLDRHEVLDLHAARQRDPAEVVAAEIDQHQVFGAFLLVAEQFVGQFAVQRGSRAAFAGSGDRAHHSRAVLQFHQRLRRGTDQHPFADLQIEGVRRGIDQPQRPVELQRRQVDFGGELQRRHHLDDVAFIDMLFRFFDHIHIIVAAHVGFQPGFSLRNRSGNPRGLPQPELEFADPPGPRRRKRPSASGTPPGGRRPTASSYGGYCRK